MSTEEAGQKAAASKSEKKGLPLNTIYDVMLNVAVELGRVDITIGGLLKLKPGSIIELNKIAGEALDIVANGNVFGRGEGVVVNDKFGVRVTQIVSPEGIDDLI